MMKTIGKYLLAVGVVAALGLGALFLIQYLRDSENPEKQAEKYMEALEKAYREDQYGGNTPEETLQLFIDALKKGDTDLAAKYFIIDEQEKWSGKLKDLANQSKLNILIEDIEKAVLEKSEDGIVVFGYDKYFEGGKTTIQGKNFEVPAGISHQNIRLGKGPNNKWKILEL